MNQAQSQDEKRELLTSGILIKLRSVDVRACMRPYIGFMPPPCVLPAQQLASQ